MLEEQTRTRRLAWEHCLNVRDLGGYPTADGRETRWRAVVRSDNLAPLTEAGRAALVAYGIRTIVDLRRPEETRELPNPFAQPGSHGVAYLNVPVEDPATPPSEEPPSLEDAYRSMLDRYQTRNADAVTAIARALEGGVLIHCAGGRDRTGLISAFLLDLAGVGRETIAGDYALSDECLRPRDEEFLLNGPGDRAERERVLEKFKVRAEVMLEALQHLDEHHGGVEAYLRQGGVSPQDIDRLRRRLLESLTGNA
jgi:protein tyrosine/serine phosphatase